MPTAERIPVAAESPASSILQVAASGLEQMLNPEQQLFCFATRLGREGLVRQGVSPRYTMMTLLGLHRWEQARQVSPVPVSRVMDHLLGDMRWLNCLGDLGLLLWTCAVLSPDRLAYVVERACAYDVINLYRDGAEHRTMELAWFLTGLCYSARTKVAGNLGLQVWTNQIFQLLTANQGPKGIFGHLARHKSLSGLARAQIGSFADQVYPIYALAQFGALTDNCEALGRASACAQKICELQGPMGEWWWHYDADTGEVVDTYPVYSVHQDGMAPMALFALGEVTGSDFSAPIAKGLSWITGNNELRHDMRCESLRVIWRNLQLPRHQQYLQRLIPAWRNRSTSPAELKVNRECRPYELGWALYALAARSI